jgi:3-hydroxyisobutyrate dehydrogenase
MSSRMAARLISAGHVVTVWNRTLEKCEPLKRLGARIAPTPLAAAHTADCVVAMVRDDAASRFVWADAEVGALRGLSSDSIAVDSSTLSMAWVQELARMASERGIPFVDAPVAGSRPQAETGKLIAFLGGEPQSIARVKPLLSHVAHQVHHAGPSGSGMAVKLSLNSLFAIQVAGVAELTAWLRARGADVTRAVEMMASTPVMSAAAKVAAASMVAGEFAPQFPIHLVAKDLAQALAKPESALQAITEMPLTAATRCVFNEAAAAGYGEHNITGVVQLYRVPLE